ncbi:hypothetical protein TNCV_606491 [Trichonephila clavipes]|nr:hypothetical protein TNCV_606491 [Trichonephila clavipes]
MYVKSIETQSPYVNEVRNLENEVLATCVVSIAWPWFKITRSVANVRSAASNHQIWKWNLELTTRCGMGSGIDHDMRDGIWNQSPYARWDLE